jgi:hypothetical protein
VLLTPVGRLKVCGLGVAEALTGEVVPANSEDLLALQRDDVVVSRSLDTSCAYEVFEATLMAGAGYYGLRHFSSRQNNPTCLAAC